MLKPTIFREYDIRGVAETELPSAGHRRSGPRPGNAAPAQELDAPINLGRDCRLSSTRLRDALLEGLMASGCEVTDIGVVPTPLLYFFGGAHGRRRRGDDHRQPQSQRVQRIQNRLRPRHLHGETIQEVLHLIQARDFRSGKGAHQDMDVINAYLDAGRAAVRTPRNRARPQSEGGAGCAATAPPGR